MYLVAYEENYFAGRPPEYGGDSFKIGRQRQQPVGRELWLVSHVPCTDSRNPLYAELIQKLTDNKKFIDIAHFAQFWLCRRGGFWRGKHRGKHRTKFVRTRYRLLAARDFYEHRMLS